MEKKRINFRDEEKVRIRELVLQRKEVVENKRSDVSSIVDKKRAWSDITDQFNCTGEFPQRTTVQLRKLWENIKARRKQELNEEKRGRFRTGGGPAPRAINEDPELDALGVDIEIENAIDSDSYRIDPNSVILYQCNPPVEGEYVTEEDPTQATEDSPRQPLVLEELEIQPTPESETRRRRGSVRANEEAAARRSRNEELMQQSKDLHMLRMEEERKKTDLINLQIERVKNDNTAEEQGKKASHLLDLQIELVKKQLEVEKKKEERAAQLHDLTVIKLQLEIDLLKAKNQRQ